MSLSKNVKFGIKCDYTFDIGNELYELRPALDFRSWLLSPNNWNGSNANVFIVFGSSFPGNLNNNNVNNTNGVRPSISLEFELEMYCKNCFVNEFKFKRKVITNVIVD